MEHCWVGALCSSSCLRACWHSASSMENDFPGWLCLVGSAQPLFPLCDNFLLDMTVELRMVSATRDVKCCRMSSKLHAHYLGTISPRIYNLGQN